jgi:hypothetical protein
MIRRITAVVLVATFAAQSAAFALDSKGAAYYGGTAAQFTGSKKPVDGTLDTTGDKALVFTATSKQFAGQSLVVYYDSIIDLEYGQKVGRRVREAVGMSLLLGPVGMLTMLSKKRRHYLTIAYKGENGGSDQVAIIELGKDVVRTMLPAIEVRSGKKVTYQDEQSRKSIK